MRGLRKREDEKFERFFAVVQQAALQRDAVFFADAGEGRDFSNDQMEGENLSGWLIPKQYADEFETLWKNGGTPMDGLWGDCYCFAIWTVITDKPTVTFQVI